MLGNSPAGPEQAPVSGRGGHLPRLTHGAREGDGECGCPGLLFTLQSGMTKPWLVPAELELEAQLCTRRKISPVSFIVLTKLGKLCWGARQTPGSSRESSVRAWPPSAHFPRFPRRTISFALGRRGFRRSTAAPAHLLLPPPPPPARGPQPGWTRCLPRWPAGSPPLPAPSFPSSFSTSRL